MSRRAVFIDKDGTLLEDVPYNVDPERVELTPNAVEGLTLLQEAGFELVLVSNPSGLARGYFDEPALVRLFRHVRRLLSDEGVELRDCYYCPHHPQGNVEPFACGCDCRKPQPGLLQRAAAEHNLDMARSWLIGDILDDVEAGKRAGCRTVLLARGSETEWRPGPFRTPDKVAADLAEAARLILEGVAPLEPLGRGGSVVAP